MTDETNGLKFDRAIVDELYELEQDMIARRLARDERISKIMYLNGSIPVNDLLRSNMLKPITVYAKGD